PKNPHLYLTSRNFKLLITDYMDAITAEKRTIFASFQPDLLKNLKEHDFDIIGVKNMTETVPYTIDAKRTVSSIATPERAGYLYFMMGKNKDYLGTVRVSAFPAEFMSASAPQD
ncbi:MAG: hypothetical protein ACTHJ4_07760, partial [Candidatus Nucleicultricaceae bacterium]